MGMFFGVFISCLEVEILSRVTIVNCELIYTNISMGRKMGALWNIFTYKQYFRPLIPQILVIYLTYFTNFQKGLLKEWALTLGKANNSEVYWSVSLGLLGPLPAGTGRGLAGHVIQRVAHLSLMWMNSFTFLYASLPSLSTTYIFSITGFVASKCPVVSWCWLRADLCPHSLLMWHVPQPSVPMTFLSLLHILHHNHHIHTHRSPHTALFRCPGGPWIWQIHSSLRVQIHIVFLVSSL